MTQELDPGSRETSLEAKGRRGLVLRAAELRALRLIAAGSPLPGILEELLLAFEDVCPGALCSILLLDPETDTMQTGSAPHLPPAYSRALEGLSIGPEAGSCGTAAWRGETVVVTDISTDPLWAPYRHLAAEHGLRACWSTPVRGASGRVLATFAVYYREPRAPERRDLELAAEWTHLVGVAVDRDRTDGALRSSQALLQMASQVSRLGAWQVDLPERRLTWSEEARLLHEMPEGYRPTGQEALDFFAPECQAPIQQAFAACAEEGVPFDRELQLVTGQGRRIWVRAIGRAVRDDEGRIVRVQGALQDVSERRAAQEQIRTLGQRLLDTLETIDSAMYTVDRDWRFTYVNAEAERLLRRSRSDLLGTDLWQEFAEAVGTRFHQEFLRAREEGVTVGLEEFYPPLGRWFEVRAHPSPEGLAVYFRDVTERVQAAEKLRQQAALLDAAQDAILVRDLEHRILYWNRSAERLYGWTAAEALGRSVETLLYRDPTEFRRGTEATVARGEWVGELEQFTRSGETRFVESRWTLVRDEAGRPASILAINTDITERRRLELQFLRAQRMESLGTLAGGIAHDLNNALSPILMALRLLKEDETDPRRTKLLDAIEVSAERGADMVAQVLAFARGVEGKRVEVRVEDLVRDLGKLTGETFPKGLEVVMDLQPDLWPLLADPTQLHQVLVNLCVNARDAMPDGGRISLRAENLVVDEHYARLNLDAQEGRFVRIEVEDTGTGIPQGILDKIFDPFFTTKPVGKGTGLGLSTSVAIVRSHGGFMRVYSEEGHGTRFCVHLPALAGGAESAVSHDLPRGHGETILIVDDEESIRQITRQTLETYGYRTLQAADGAEAVALYARHRDEIAAVITDMVMPVMNGPATIEALLDLNPDVRIIGASGWMADLRRVEVGKGVRHFLPKPCTAESLLRTLKRVLA